MVTDRCDRPSHLARNAPRQMKPLMTSLIEARYQELIRHLSVKERVARSAALFEWSRQMLRRQILAAKGPLSEDRLKWEVALRQYGAEPAMRKLIQRKLNDVSD